MMMRGKMGGKIGLDNSIWAWDNHISVFIFYALRRGEVYMATMNNGQQNRNGFNRQQQQSQPQKKKMNLQDMADRMQEIYNSETKDFLRPEKENTDVHREFLKAMNDVHTAILALNMQVQNYKALAYNDVMMAVRPVLLKYGLMIYLVDIKRFKASRIEYSTDRGTRSAVQIFGIYEYEIYHVHTGTSFRIVQPVSAENASDKAAYASGTMGLKYALAMLFLSVRMDGQDHELINIFEDVREERESDESNVSNHTITREEIIERTNPEPSPTPAQEPAKKKAAANPDAHLRHGENLVKLFELITLDKYASKRAKYQSKSLQEYQDMALNDIDNFKKIVTYVSALARESLEAQILQLGNAANVENLIKMLDAAKTMKDFLEVNVALRVVS
jgi:hypothetical protein